MTKAHFYQVFLFTILGLILPTCMATAQVSTATNIPDPTRFKSEIEKINKIRFDNSQERIVFTGSSSIRFWLDVQERYPTHQVIQTGFGGSEMSDLLHYLDETVLRFKPSQVFVYEGDNDVNAKRSTTEIMDNTKKVVQQIQQKLPDCEIVLISAKPSIARWSLKSQYDAINKAFKAYAAEEAKISYANVWDIMLAENGEVRKDIFIQDGLHMNKEGYDLWDKIIQPMVGIPEGWQPLFNGKNFEGFEQLNGKAIYKVEDQQMVGYTTPNTPNSFMATTKKYDDFILEFEVQADNAINSGVQFRSLSMPEYNNGRVHGYQCEIESSARKWAGGIYDEARRGWLYPLTRNEKGRQAFITGGWNHYRIEAIGNNIRTWINGVQCANLVDDMTAEGLIGFQVHGIYHKSQEGTQVKWRNIKIKTTDLENARNRPDPSVPTFSYLNNQLTETEKRAGWQLLWDGKTTNGWRGAKSTTFPEKGWAMEDGTLTISKSANYIAGKGGDIITQKLYSNFELSVDFKITAGANSGIKYFVDPQLLAAKGTAIGLEFQILDDRKHPDAKQGKNGNRTVGSLYDMIRAQSFTPRKSKNFKGGNQWNNARIVVKDGKVEHWLNHTKVVEYDRFSQVFLALIEKSKYENYEDFGRLTEGHILLQDHGDTVSFRNIKIREF